MKIISKNGKLKRNIRKIINEEIEKMPDKRIVINIEKWSREWYLITGYYEKGE